MLQVTFQVHSRSFSNGLVQRTPPHPTRPTSQANLRPVPKLLEGKETRAIVSPEVHPRFPHPWQGPLRVHKPHDHSPTSGIAQPPPWSHQFQWNQKGPGRKRRKRRRTDCPVLPSAKATLPTYSPTLRHTTQPGRRRTKRAPRPVFISCTALARVREAQGYWKESERRGIWPEPRPNPTRRE